MITQGLCLLSMTVVVSGFVIGMTACTVGTPTMGEGETGESESDENNFLHVVFLDLFDSSFEGKMRDL